MKFLDDLRNLDRHNVGGWPKSIKIFFTGLVFVVVLLAGWYFQISSQQDDLANAESQEERLKTEFSTKQAKSANLEALEQQLADMQDMLRTLLRQLPSKTEMPELLIDISQTALAAGIENELFQPGPEMIKEFYAEKPISLRMIGSYHQFGAFISGVASLPRVVILTMHDVSLRPQGKGPGQPAPKKDAPIQAGGILTLEGTVKTYRYVEDDESVTAPGTPGAPGTGTPATPAAGQKPAAGGG
jgi:type IV pilus assembly protein PilO